MPYLNLFPVLSPRADIVEWLVSYAVTAGASPTFTLYEAPVGTTVTRTGTGTHLITLPENYYACASSDVNYNQSTIEAARSAQVSFPMGTGQAANNVGTLTYYNTTTGAAADPGQVTTFTVYVAYRKSPVP